MAPQEVDRAPLSRREQEVAALVAEGLTNRAIATQQMIAGYILGLCVDLMGAALVQAGQGSRQYIQDHMVVSLNLDLRTASVVLVVPMVSQLGVINGTIKYVFDF